jgi:hypothetical protein
MRILLVMAACIALMGCSDSTAAKDAVLETLIDPESARFGEISFSRSGKLACVEVNAKNRMGGYTGDNQVVVAELDDGKWAVVDEAEEMSHDSCIKLIDQMKS